MLSLIPRDAGRTIRWVEDCFQKIASHRLEKCVWSPTEKHFAAYLTPVWGDIPRLISGQAGQEVVAFCCRGKPWLEERTPEQLKVEGD